jgi:hypothetical protein
MRERGVVQWKQEDRELPERVASVEEKSFPEWWSVIIGMLTANAFYSIFFLWLKPKEQPIALLEQTLVLDGGLTKVRGIFSGTKEPQSPGIKEFSFLLCFPVMPWFYGCLLEVAWILLTDWLLLLSPSLSPAPYARGRMRIWVTFFFLASFLTGFGILFLASLICPLLLPAGRISF